MSLALPPRVAVAGILFLLGLSTRVEAGPFFHKCCQSDCCNAEVVKLPAQQVTVEATRPQVTVHERVARYSRVAAPVAPVVATVYTPALVSLPVAASLVESSPATFRESTGASLLRAAHEMEFQHMEVEKLRAAHQAEMQATNRVYARLRTSLSQAGDTPTPASNDAILAQLKDLNDRLTSLEKLVYTHDNFIKKKLIAP
ncbi:MAG: hypothetical protein HYS12_17995 [Planctomycetes bacterium]|nr:hypothetical protein [Planctomycetota bacterium]